MLNRMFSAHWATQSRRPAIEENHRLAAASPHPRATTRNIRRPVPMLIVDESLTSRMLEQSVLESARHEVDLASSGEEGLEKAGARRHGLFLVDVEMPGMRGFAASRRCSLSVGTTCRLAGSPWRRHPMSCASGRIAA